MGLLDVNVLVGLFDPAHIHHDLVHEWFSHNRADGWVTCPLTENGVIRVLSNPAYPGRRTTLADAVDRLQRFCRSGHHTFWPDSVSLCESELLSPSHIRGHRQVTDVYLLALAVAREGRLVTLDGGISLDSVRGATADHLELITD